VIADRPQTIVWAFTISSRTSIWRFMAIWPSVESLFSITPLPEPFLTKSTTSATPQHPQIPLQHPLPLRNPYKHPLSYRKRLH